MYSSLTHHHRSLFVRSLGRKTVVKTKRRTHRIRLTDDERTTTPLTGWNRSRTPFYVSASTTQLIPTCEQQAHKRVTRRHGQLRSHRRFSHSRSIQNMFCFNDGSSRGDSGILPSATGLNTPGSAKQQDAPLRNAHLRITVCARPVQPAFLLDDSAARSILRCVEANHHQFCTIACNTFVLNPAQNGSACIYGRKGGEREREKQIL